MKQQVQQAAQSCTNVRFLPFRPACEIPSVMAAGDLHAVTIKRGLEGVVVPSKMYNILAAGRPLLAVATQKAEVARWAERYGCGLAADPDDAEEVAKSVRGVLAAPERLEHMSGEARKLAKTYDRLNELRKFVGVIEQAASG